MSGTRISSLWVKITVLFVICCCSLPAHAKYGSGTGEPNDPYLIFDANQMNAIGTDANDWDKCFKLMADIDLRVFDGNDGRPEFNIIAPDVNDDEPAFQGIPFKGIFDGNDHSISNFAYDSNNRDCIGLFGFVEDGKILNLGLIDPNVNAEMGEFVGSLVGWLWDGTIIGCYVEGGSISGDYLVGGLVGWNVDGTITNCYATGSISGEWYVGGLVGYNGGTITNCYSTGSVEGGVSVGGLVGWNYFRATITNCYSTGSTSGEGYVGGLVGYNELGTVSTSFWDIETSGQNTSDGGTGLSTAEMQTMTTFTDAGWDFVGETANGTEDIWWICEGSDYPRLWWEEKYGGGSGHPNNPYLIYTAEQMNTIGACQCDWDKHFLLCADIDLTGFLGTEFNIIGYWVDWDSPDNKPFTGVFDGNGHCISNFVYKSFAGTSGVGLFRYIGILGYIKNLRLRGVDIKAGHNFVGALAGVSLGTISNCHVTGSLTTATDSGSRIGGMVGDNSGVISNSHTTVFVLPSPYNWTVGGLVGFNSGTISNCYACGSVSGKQFIGGLVGFNSKTISDSYATGSVSGTYEAIGGLVGINSYGIILACYYTGSITGGEYCDEVGGLVGRNSHGTISHSYTGASVKGGGFNSGQIGGLVGRNYDGEISHSYATGMVTAEGDGVGGLVGCNYEGIISCSFATSPVFTGDFSDCVGGLVGSNFSNSLISESFASGDVSGKAYVGGLVGHTRGTNAITNCWAGGNISGNENVGGLVGYNKFHYGSTSIYHCYAVGSVPATGTSIGGLVGGGSSSGSSSFWDIFTSGTTYSKSGTGKTTAEMQMMSTFTDAGWDFVGETFNGIEDIWFIPEGDYPHLWWEGMQVLMKLTPRKLNCRSKGNWVKAHLTLPEGFTVADVDSNRPAVLHSFGFESAPLDVFVNENELVEIEAAFEREAVCSLAGDWPEALTVAGFLTDGNIFLGTSKVRMITPGLKDIEELALYWLNADCVQPDFCDGIDLNRDSMVNLLDYALLLNCQVEFVSE